MFSQGEQVLCFLSSAIMLSPCKKKKNVQMGYITLFTLVSLAEQSRSVSLNLIFQRLHFSMNHWIHGL